ncbi:DMT family transporter [Prescottella subtropica]|uniref:DMT family transporter n=1 Tax=Prescottella subtropica TaxID=2545757 RepID=UPI0010F841FF|nr:multidrug efflux SMR transporter [Prescottella subtropica]
MMWLFLIGAILTEVVGTLALRTAVHTGRTTWYGVTAAGYLAAFTLLSLALDRGMTIGVAYGIWSAAGVAIIALASRVLFREPLTRVMMIGIGLIVAGVLCIELGAMHG